jgi:Glycosyl transferases group 1
VTLRRLRNAATNAAWLAAPGRRELVGATWPLAGWELDRLVVTWPESYEWEGAGNWVEPLRHEFGRLLRVESGDIAQPYKGIVVVQFALDGEPHVVVIDYSDYPDINQQALGAAQVYFKMQFVPGSDPRVVPGGYPPTYGRLYRYLPRLRRLRDRRRFRHEVYGRFGSGQAADLRARAVHILEEQTRVGYEGGFKPVGYGEYLREVARSKVCIDLPGNGDFCFRLVEYLAVGACVIAPRPRNQLHVPLVSGEHVVHAREDLTDLVELCERYVEDEQARERVATNARAYFDRYLDRRQLASWYLRSVLDRLA